MNKIVLVMICIIFTCVCLFPKATVRVKDITRIEGIRKNQIRGLGLVAGLNGKGDSANNPLTKAALENYFTALGLSADVSKLSARNTALVNVSADIDGFISDGDRISASVASVGDAKSLVGGVLLQTALKASDGTTFAVAMGPIVVSEAKNAPATAGSIPDGAIVEKGFMCEFINNGTFSLTVNNSDFQTVNNIHTAITARFPDAIVTTADSKIIRIGMPSNVLENPVQFISQIQALEVEVDTSAKVVIDSKNGIIVMGEDVRISQAAVSVSGIKISVREGISESDENAKKRSTVLPDSATVQSLVDGLNDLGVDVKDTIQLLLALKKNGALNAEIIVTP